MEERPVVSVLASSVMFRAFRVSNPVKAKLEVSMDSDREQYARERLERRLRRYENKHDPARVADLLAAKRAEMVRKYGEYARTAAQVSRAVCDVTDNAGVVCMMRIWYQTFGREIEKLWRHHHDRDISDELGVLRYKWTVRGLVPIVLDKVEAAVLAELRRQDEESGQAAQEPR